MDLTDRKIICELDINCRLPVSRLARKLKITATTSPSG
jgi:DNA-binding Lrp family transcriptional regulator